MEPNTTKQNTWAIPLAIVIAGALVAGAVFLSGNKQVATGPAKKTPAKEVRKISKEDHVLGNPNAPIVFIEYSDLQCPFCQDFHKAMEKIMATNGKDGKVAWVYRHFWSERKDAKGNVFHPLAGKAAEASECVNELGGPEKFWSFIGKVFETPTSQKETLTNLSGTAESIGIEKEAFNKCLSSGKYAKMVQKAFDEGREFGVTGTPNTFVVSNKGTVLIPGATDEVELTNIINSLSE